MIHYFWGISSFDLEIADLFIVEFVETESFIKSHETETYFPSWKLLKQKKVEATKSIGNHVLFVKSYWRKWIN